MLDHDHKRQQRRERQRRFRSRVKRGVTCALVELTARRLDVLFVLGHLNRDATNPRELGAAVERLLDAVEVD
jgi:hypothetical protein